MEYAKASFRTCQGKHDYDKRESIKRREQNRDIALFVRSDMNIAQQTSPFFTWAKPSLRLIRAARTLLISVPVRTIPASIVSTIV